MQLHRPRRHHTEVPPFALRFSLFAFRQEKSDVTLVGPSSLVRICSCKPSSFESVVDLRLWRKANGEQRIAPYAWPGRNVLVLGMQPLISMATMRPAWSSSRVAGALNTASPFRPGNAINTRFSTHAAEGSRFRKERA